MAIQKDNWDIILSTFTGLKTDKDSDVIPAGFSPNLLNVRVTGSHFVGALGYELTGTRDNNAGEISSKYTFNRHDGDEVMVRVKDNGTSGTLEWYDATNEEWYTLLESLTTGKIMGFTEFNTSTTSRMIFCNGVENMSVWTGATTRLTATVSGSPSSISVVSTADFPSSGTIMYNGTEIAYDSKTSTTFVKSSGSFHDSDGLDDGVAEAVDDSTHSGVTKGNILLSAFDRLWIAGQPSSPSAFDFSDEGAPFTFTGGATRTDSGTEDVFNIGGRITGISNKEEEIIILGPDGAVGFKFTYPTSTTKAPVYREIFHTPGQGCTFQKSVFKVNNEVFFTNKNGVQALGDSEGSERIINKSITRIILPTLKNYDFSEASAIYYDKESILLIACKTDPDFSFNDIVIGLDFYIDEEGNDTYGIVKFDWPVNDWTILDDELYFGSSAEMNSFKGLSTNQNDGAPRTIRYATKRFNLGDPFQNKMSRLAAVKGFIKTGTDIDVEILYNAGFKGTINKTIKSDGVYVSNSTLNSIGAFQMGTNPIGSNKEEVSDLKEFTVYLDLGSDYDYRDIQMIFSSETDGGNFLITDIGFTADETGFESEDNLTI